MKRILTLVALSLFLCSTTSTFQGGGGESTKRGSNKKKEATKKKTSGAKSDNTTPRNTTRGAGTTMPRTRTNQAGIEFVLIPAGEFMMGSTNGEADEKPVHRVAISQPFYMGKYEVTQTQWQAVMSNNPSYFKNCDSCPVEQVSWDDTQQFLAKLNERNDGFHYRLPSEAEWEYACRAGTTGDYAGDLDSMAWYENNSGNKTHPVGTKRPNAWGLYDMHVNVFEWCQDWYEGYKAGPAVDPSGPATGHRRVLRGGSWFLSAAWARSANRGGSYSPDSRLSYNGFRVVEVVRPR